MEGVDGVCRVDGAWCMDSVWSVDGVCGADGMWFVDSVRGVDNVYGANGMRCVVGVFRMWTMRVVWTECGV